MAGGPLFYLLLFCKLQGIISSSVQLIKEKVLGSHYLFRIRAMSESDAKVEFGYRAEPIIVHCCSRACVQYRPYSALKKLSATWLLQLSKVGA